MSSAKVKLIKTKSRSDLINFEIISMKVFKYYKLPFKVNIYTTNSQSKKTQEYSNYV